MEPDTRKPFYSMKPPEIMKRYSSISLTVAVAALLVVGAACTDSPFDPNTKLGEQIVDDIEPGFTDPEGNFRVRELSIPVTATFSFIDSLTVRTDNDSSDTITAGSFVWDIDSLFFGQRSQERSVTYIQYSGKRVLSEVQELLDSGCGFGQAQLLLPQNSLDSAAMQNLSLAFARPKSRNIPADEDSVILTFTNSVFVSDSALVIQFDGSRFIEQARESLPFIDTITVNAENEADTVRDTSDVAFFLFADNPLINIAANDPQLRILSGDEAVCADNPTFAVTASDFTVRDLDPAATDDSLVSSAATARFAAIALNIEPLWEALTDTVFDTQFQNILAATLDLPLYTARLRGADSTFRLVYRLTTAQPDELIQLDSLRLSAALAKTPAQGDSLRVEDFLNVFLEPGATQPSRAFLIMKPTIETANPNEIFTRIDWEVPDTLEMKAVLSNAN
jgi:hypothetical protein